MNKARKVCTGRVIQGAQTPGGLGDCRSGETYSLALSPEPGTEAAVEWVLSSWLLNDGIHS